MALLLLFLPFAVSISASSPKLLTAPSSLITATLPPQLSAPPAWTKNEVRTCSSDFSRGKIDPWDCLQALTKVTSGSAPVRFDRKAPKGAPNSLPFYAIHESCTIKFETSGRNASSLSTILFRPFQIREMVSFVTERCVLPNKLGGFITRQIKNTAEYLNNPSVDADFVHGFPTGTTFFSLLIYYSGEYYDTYNPGNNDPEVANVLDDGVVAAAKRYPVGKERDILLDRSAWMQRAFDKMDREFLVNWWDYYAFDGVLTLPGARNTTSPSCINGTSTCIDVVKRQEHDQSYSSQ